MILLRLSQKPIKKQYSITELEGLILRKQYKEADIYYQAMKNDIPKNIRTIIEVMLFKKELNI